MSIETEINRIDVAKNAIAYQIRTKGVTVPPETKLDAMASLIGKIPTGANIEIVDYRQTSDTPIRVSLKSGAGPIEVWGWGQLGTGFASPVYLFLGTEYSDYIGGMPNPMAPTIDENGYIQNFFKIDQGKLLIVRRN